MRSRKHSERRLSKNTQTKEETQKHSKKLLSLGKSLETQRREISMTNTEKKDSRREEEWEAWTSSTFLEDAWGVSNSKEDLRKERQSCIQSKLLLKTSTWARHQRSWFPEIDYAPNAKAKEAKGSKSVALARDGVLW
jgi:hypothetical protein